MIAIKNNITGNINPKSLINGNINVGERKILPILQEKTVTPTEELQEIIFDEGYDGLSKVNINKIPNDYIIPTGEQNILANGAYDIRDKASVNVEVPEKVLGTKTITNNGTYNASDDNLDGYSNVNINVQVQEISPSKLSFSYCEDNSIYLDNINISRLTDLSYIFQNCINVTSLNLSRFSSFNPSVNTLRNMFQHCDNLLSIDVSNFNTSNIINMTSMFDSCAKLTLIDLSSFDTSNVVNLSNIFFNCNSLEEINISSFTCENLTNISQMFHGCINLRKIDMRNMTFDNVTNSSYLFGRYTQNLVPYDCLVIVKGTAEKDWMNTKFPNMINVKTVEEYNASL